MQIHIYIKEEQSETSHAFIPGKVLCSQHLASLSAHVI